jgi:hypothetical protein
MYTENEIEEYGKYMDWVREQIVKNEEDDIVVYKNNIDIEEITMQKGPNGKYWKIEWLLNHPEGLVVGMLNTQTFDDWLAIKVMEKRNDRLKEIGI